MRIKIFLISVISALAVVTACASAPVTVMVKDSGEESVKAKAGREFKIQLKSQLSTGYSWKMMEMPASFTLTKENVKAETEGDAIAGGYEIQEFVFKASKPGGVIIFKYAEHWKKKPEYVKTSAVTVQVE